MDKNYLNGIIILAALGAVLVATVSMGALDKPKDNIVEVDHANQEQASLSPSPMTSSQAYVSATTAVTATATPAPLFITLTPMNQSGQSGVATILTDTDGQEQVSFNFSGKVALQPAVIYEGSCTDPRQKKYELNPLKDGGGVTILDKVGSRLLDSRSALVIMIGASLSEPERFVACGVVS
ncbi:MAG: hypothetical protein Q7S32_00915 [bacterium]|nr:hypothetical protein [bacterium]